jgi:L-erythro-3,5-diaminohexanoate dehydrogenase
LTALVPSIQPDADAVERLGAARVLEPVGALPQAAERLDATTPPGEAELSIDVELLNLDATSHRQIRAACGDDPEAMATTIAGIVSRRGKMHNPETGSGGVLVGRVLELGSRFPLGGGLRSGDRVVPLASLTLIPLGLESVGPVDVASPQVPVRGRAIIPAVVPWARVPDDLPLPLVLAALDVYGAPSHVRALTVPGEQVLVLGAGRAGLLSAAAAIQVSASAGSVTVADINEAALENAAAALPGVRTVRADAADPLAALAALKSAGLGAPAADLTVVVVNQRGCELTAVLATALGGTVLYFSMATSFTAVALGAEGVASTARLLVGTGYAPDRGDYALELLRGDETLRAGFERLR